MFGSKNFDPHVATKGWTPPTALAWEVDGGEAWRSELVPVGDLYFLLCNSEQPATVPGCFSGTGSSCMLPTLCDLEGKQNV